MNSTPTPPDRRLLVLASQSRYRLAMLQKLHLDPLCHPTHIDESPIKGELPQQTALRLACEKADAAAQHHARALIIGSDQVAELDGQPLGKPGTRQRAVEQLSACSGKSVLFHTAVCLLNSATGRRQQSCETVTVKFRPLSADFISGYLEREDVLDCAGSFKSEGLGIALFKSIEATDPNTLQGLPVIRLLDFLAQEGYGLFPEG
ncbi:Maf family nucleotide pyrophosphatase [Spongiibacter taiwanensis]|uniref:Maf family protein n=1 Tax=Spongiibacter taiwanensis TaxID=1748242 RepID=UPI00203573F7|nr:nucleoside triphosphate pyrophosphatase [Spongiibacter taiwanensis]USA43376.1 Maf family nucleotide pyrophosphatase [Spongiibacter taiwanensis]